MSIELDLTKDRCPTNYMKVKWTLLKTEYGKRIKLIFSDLKTAEIVRKSLEKDSFNLTVIENVDSKFIFYVWNAEVS